VGFRLGFQRNGPQNNTKPSKKAAQQLDGLF
jgi:hypothetical protein